MLSNPQKALLKRAQRQAGLNDDDYREALELISGCNSSTDPRMGDEHLDALLAYLEAIYWRSVDSGALQPPKSDREPFVKPGFWAERNNRGSTSRDRYSRSSLVSVIQSLEAELAGLGFGEGYCAAIKKRVIQGAETLRSLHAYRAALERTISSKRNARIEQQF